MTRRREATEAVRGAGRRRRELVEAIDALERAVAAPAADPAWATLVAGELRALAETFEHHVAEVEGPGGLFEEISEEAPRLHTEIEWFRQDHRRLGDRIAELAERTEREDRAIMRDLVTDLIADLQRHRQRGADLVYEAYMVDLGGW